MIKKSKKVCQYDIQGNLIEIHLSLSKAEVATGIKQPNITSCCKGRMKTAGGFKWSYLQV